MTVSFFTINLSTDGDGDVHDITPQVIRGIGSSELSAGMANIFVPGSTGAVTTIEFEEGVVKDLVTMFDRIISKKEHYDHDARWGDGNGYSHVRAALLGPSMTVPFSENKPLLGSWQQIVFIDFDNRPRRREIIVQLIG